MHKLLPQSESMGTSGISRTPRINVKKGGGRQETPIPGVSLKKNVFQEFPFSGVSFFSFVLAHVKKNEQASGFFGVN